MRNRSTTIEGIKKVLLGFKIGKSVKRELTIEEQIEKKEKELAETRKSIKEYSEAIEEARARYAVKEEEEKKEIEVPEKFINICHPFDSRIYYQNILTGLVRKELRLELDIEELKRKIK